MTEVRSIGAEALTKTICIFMSQSFDELIEQDEDALADRLLDVLINSIEQEAKRLETNVENLSSTILFVAIKGNQYVCGHLGDGVIGCARNSNLEILSLPDRGEFANETYFVTSSKAKSRFRIQKGSLNGVQGFILMSDGAAESLYDRQIRTLSIGAKNILEWLDTNLSITVSKALRKNLKKLFIKKTGDDCSVIILRKVSKDLEAIKGMAPSLKKEFLRESNIINANNQLKILDAIDSGIRSSKEIADRASMSIQTTRKHLKRMRERGILVRKMWEYFINTSN